VLTGPRGVGKTFVCTELAAEARARDLDVAGILTGQSGPGPDSPREVVDLRTGQTRLFAARISLDNAPLRGDADHSSVSKGQQALGGLGGDSEQHSLTPGWEYAPKVFEWANGVLSRATPCDLLIVDEVGPLELLGDYGWTKALQLLREGDFGAALVVCRPSLLDELQSNLGGPPARLFEIDPKESYALPGIILKEMFG